MPVPLKQICQRGVCMQPATVQIGSRTDPEYICEECHSKDKAIQIRKIIIDPHNCTRYEYGNLITYLEENSWDYKFIKKEKD